MTFGEKIKQIRLTKGLTLEEVAEKSVDENGKSFARQRIWQLENNGAKDIRITTLFQLSKGLDCTIMDIIAEPLGLENKQACELSDNCSFFKEIK